MQTTTQEIETARLHGITYRSDDYRTAVILDGDSAIYQVGDGMGWTESVRVSIEYAWNLIARRSLRLVSAP